MSIPGGRNYRRTSDERPCSYAVPFLFFINNNTKGMSMNMTQTKSYFLSCLLYLSAIQQLAMDKLSVKEYKDPFEEKEIKKENQKRKAKK